MNEVLGRTSDPSEWVERYGDELHRFALSRLRDAYAAEETVQETFLAAIRFRRQFRGSGTEKGWLFAILRRKIVDYARSRATFRSRDGDPRDRLHASIFDLSGSLNMDLMPFDADPSKLAEDRELWQEVQECLDDLPRRQAHAFVLRELDEMSTDEICEALDISHSNLSVLLHRARRSLADGLLERWNAGVPHHCWQCD